MTIQSPPADWQGVALAIRKELDPQPAYRQDWDKFRVVAKAAGIYWIGAYM